MFSNKLNSVVKQQITENAILLQRLEGKK